MQLWQLTDKDSSLRGYICMPILIQSEEEIIVKLEAETYIVPGMMVPILLGEDYQLNYKVGVMRNLEEGTQIYFGETDFKIFTQRVDQAMDFNRMHQSTLLIACPGSIQWVIRRVS